MKLEDVTRAVRQGLHGGHHVHVVVASCLYKTSVPDLWDALTSAERLPRWFLPVEGDLRVGGRYQLQGNAGGEIVECEPHRRFSLTWVFDGNITWLHVQVADEPDGQARLELEHLTPVGSDHWDQYGPGAVGVGWDTTLRGLELHLSGQKPDAAWMASDEGKAFVRASSQDWGRAHEASGCAPGVAHAAAARTAAAYTADEED